MAFSPDIFEEDANLGLENLGQDDLALPFLKLLRRQDPVLDDLDDAKAGDILNTVSNTVYSGKTGIRVIPSAYQRRFIEWAPRGTGSGAPVNIYTPEDTLPKVERDPNDNKDYVVGGNGTYLEETHQHFVVILEEDGTTYDCSDPDEIYAVEEKPQVELHHCPAHFGGQKRAVYTPTFQPHLSAQDCL